MKNLISALLLAATTPLLVAAQTFTDFDSNNPHAQAIWYMSDQGFVQGYSDGTYRPNANINRAEFLKIIMASKRSESELANCDHSTIPFPESDVPKTAWFAPFICVAFQDGIISGYPDGTFRPGNTISFVEAAKIIAEASNLPVEPGEQWYEGYVNALSNQSAIPTTITTLSGELNRGEMANIIHRIHAEITVKPSKSLLVLKQGEQEKASAQEQSSSSSSLQNESHTETNEPEVIAENNSEENVITLPQEPEFVLPKIDALFDPYEFFPAEINAAVRSLVDQTPQPVGEFELLRKDNVYLYYQGEGVALNRAFLLIRSDITPTAINPMWQKLEGSTFSNPIVQFVRPGYEREGVLSTELPGELGNTVQKYYGGQLDFVPGTHVTTRATIRGIMGEALIVANAPNTNLIATIGREVPALSWETGAAGGVEKTKKDGSFKDALEPTNYITLKHDGIWNEPLSMANTSLTDATIYYDSGNAFGFWGVGTFESNPFVMFYKGPLVKSKNPQDYVEAQIGFGAENMNLAEYLKFISAYSTRLPGGSYSFLGEANASRDAAMDATFAGLNALPLDIVTVKNAEIPKLAFKSGDNFPGPKYFNGVVLGPLAQSADGTRGPLAKVTGAGELFSTTFGDIDFQIDATGAKSTSNGSVGIGLGSLSGKDLGTLGGDMSLGIVADAASSAMTLAGTINAGPFGGKGLTMSFGADHMEYALAASCAFPLNVKATSSLTGVPRFSPSGAVPDPSALLSCPEDIFFAIKNGVVYAFTASTKLLEMGEGLLPENDVTRIGVEGIKVAGGAIIEGPEEIVNLAKQVPGVGELSELQAKIADEAAKAAEEAAKRAAEEARRRAEQAAREAQRAAEEAARAAEQAYNQTLNFTNNLTSGAAHQVIDGLGSVVSSVGGAVGSIFGGGSSGPPGFGWLQYCCGRKAIDISLGHKNHLWYVETNGDAWYGSPAGTHRFQPKRKMLGSVPSGGFVRIDADDQGRAVAVTKKGHMYYVDSNNRWRRSDNPMDYALDIGIGGGYLWAISTQRHPNGWPGYKIYRTRYTSGAGNWNWQEIPGAAMRIDVGSDGKAWAINEQYQVWEYENSGWVFRNGTGLDVSVSNSNRAWIIGTNYNHNSGGGQIFTYETHVCAPTLTGLICHAVTPYWQPTAGWAKSIAAGQGPSVMVSNSVNNIYGGTGRE